MQRMIKLFHTLGGSLLVTASASLIWIPLCIGASAQDSTQTMDRLAPVLAPVIPQQVRYAGTLPNRTGDALEATFSIYSAQNGGEAMWSETQRVSVGTDGSYTVLLGSANQSGLPQAIFSGGEARWLGVSIEGGEELPRTQLVSVAYAMKAGDAETVGGLPASSLVTQQQLAAAEKTVTAQPGLTLQPEVSSPTGTGTTNYVPLWTGTSTLGNSAIYQSGSNIGIGTTSPTQALDVVGAGIFQNTGTAAAFVANRTDGRIGAFGAGGTSVTLSYDNAGIFKVESNTRANIALPVFGTGATTRLAILGNGNVGIGTATPAATLEVNGTTQFDSPVTFAATQTFPAAELESSLTGVYAQLAGNNDFAAQATFSDGALGYMALGPGFGAIIGQGTGGSIGVYGSSDSGYGVEGLSASGPGVYAVSTSGNGITATSTSGNPGSFSNSSAPKASILASNSGAYDGSYYPVALNATSTGTDSVGAFGEGTLIGLWAETTAAGTYALYSTASNGYGGYFSNSGTSYPTVFAQNNAAGSSTVAPIVYDASASGNNAYGVYSDVTGAGAYGLYGESDGGIASGSGRSATGVKGLAAGADSYGVVGDATGAGGYGLYGYASGAQDTTNYAPIGVYGLSSVGSGVVGVAVGNSSTYNSYKTGFSPSVTAGVWGDSSSNGANFEVGGIMGTADNNSAGFFVNKSTGSATIQAYNQASGGASGLVTGGIFNLFKASTPAGTCGIGDGDISCTGQVKTLVTTGGGARTVETYAMQSPENWMEDFGTGTLVNGAGVVQIEPAFAETVTGDASYHVFLTPRGDSKGLYVTNVTATSFEVHESSGGTSSLSFDYRIVAKRRGFETQRLADVTERFRVEQAASLQRMPRAGIIAPASSGVVEANVLAHQVNQISTASMRSAMPNPNGRPGGGVVPALSPKPIARPLQGPAPKPVVKPVQ